MTSTTVTGTVAVTQSGTWDEVGINDSGNSITVDNGGTFAVQVDGAALTALQLIDDPIATLGTTTYTEAASKGMVIGAVRRDADTTLVDTTNEVAPLIVDSRGLLKVEAFSGETLPVSLTSTTVTGTVAVTQSGTWDEVGINDSGNSITVDAPVGTPAFVRLSDGAAAITTLAVSLASVPSHAVTNAGTFATQVDGSALTALQLIDDPVFADDAAFTVGTSKVTMGGVLAVAHGTNPDEADALDAGARIANRHRIPFTLGGHPNLQSSEYFTSGAITDDNILPAISAGTIYVITSITVTCSAANVTQPTVRIGFGASTLTAQGSTNADAVAKTILSHPGIAAGSGITKGNGSGIVGVGGDGEELRITCTTPTTSLIVQVDWFTISS